MVDVQEVILLVAASNSSLPNGSRYHIYGRRWQKPIAVFERPSSKEFCIEYNTIQHQRFLLTLRRENAGWLACDEMS